MRFPRSDVQDLGTAPRKAYGLLHPAAAKVVWPWVGPLDVPSDLSNRTLSVCNKGDLLCNVNFPTLEGYDIHTRSYGSLASDAGQQLAQWATSYPLPANPHMSVRGMVGRPLTANITALSSAAPKWRVTTGDLPLGLRLDRDSGQISGIPRKPVSGTATVSITRGDSTPPPLRSTSASMQSVSVPPPCRQQPSDGPTPPNWKAKPPSAR